MSGLTVNVLDELSEPMGVEVEVSPGKEAVRVYEFDGSDGRRRPGRWSWRCRTRIR